MSAAYGVVVTDAVVDSSSLLTDKELRLVDDNLLVVSLTYKSEACCLVAQNGGSALPQTAVIKLKDLTESSSGSATAVTEWQLGKRYTYTIVFGLEEIYFDPAVADWTDVTMDEYEIKESDI